MVENTGQEVAQGTCRLNHEQKYEIELEKHAQTVLVSNYEVEQQIEQEWNEKHNRNLCKQFCGCVDPNLI